MGSCLQIQCQKVKYILQSELATLMGKPSESDTVNNYVIIDVREEFVDYDGGQIRGSVNIPEDEFVAKIPDIFAKYNTKKKLIFCDMYGAETGRSLSCFQHYKKCKKEIISHYGTETSYYTMKNEDNNHEKIAEMINNKTSKERIDINCNREMINNLSKQQVFVLKGGVFEIVNSSFADLVDNFDESKWEQLALPGFYGDQKRWYHQNEYFSDDKFADNQQNEKRDTLPFKGASSKDGPIKF
eukprot:UN00882